MDELSLVMDYLSFRRNCFTFTSYNEKCPDARKGIF
jgi:hypothetical protein